MSLFYYIWLLKDIPVHFTCLTPNMHNLVQHGMKIINSKFLQIKSLLVQHIQPQIMMS